MTRSSNLEDPQGGRCRRYKIFSRLAARFIREEDGATAIEYVILAASIAAVIVVIVASIGTKTVGNLTLPDF